MRHRVKFRQNRSTGCGDIAILRFSIMAAAAILDFRKFKFLRTDTLARPNLRHLLKFRHSRSIVAEIWRFFYYSRWLPSAMLDF